MRSKLEIFLSKLKENLEDYCKIIEKEKIMAVVKANAYGFGYREIVDFLIKQNIYKFAVATYEEAINLRKINDDIMILILGIVENENIIELANNNIHITVADFDQIDYILKNNIKVNVHLAFDTGMGRIGYDENNIEKAIELIKPIGIFTHLSSAENNEEFSLKQLEKFENIVSKYDIKYKHALNSVGTKKYYNKYNYDLYRIGISLYENISTFSARVVYIKHIECDTNIGYENTYTAKKGEIIATVSCGYADGLNRKLSNNHKVYFNGAYYDIVGNICMDQFMIKVDENIQIGDYVEIYGDNVAIKDVASKCDTISYEIFCNINYRVKRIYRKEQ